MDQAASGRRRIAFVLFALVSVITAWWVYSSRPQPTPISSDTKSSGGNSKGNGIANAYTNANTKGNGRSIGSLLRGFIGLNTLTLNVDMDPSSPPYVFVPQCQVDGFYSNVRQLIDTIGFYDELVTAGIDFVAVTPELYYIAQHRSQWERVGPIPYLSIFFADALAEFLDRTTESAEIFSVLPLDMVRVAVSGGGYR